MEQATSPIAAKTALSNLNSRLDDAQEELNAAKESLNDAAVTAANERIDAIVSEATGLIAAITAESVSSARAKTMIKAAAADLSPAKLKVIAETNRVSTSADGITLPAGKYENLSRGKGWCRLGSGSNAVWGEKVSGGYRVAVAGEWTVGSSDGFSRKDSTTWSVTKIGDFGWIAD